MTVLLTESVIAGLPPESCIEGLCIVLQNLSLRSELLLGCVRINCKVVKIDSELIFNPSIALRLSNAVELVLLVDARTSPDSVFVILQQISDCPEVSELRIVRANDTENEYARPENCLLTLNTEEIPPLKHLKHIDMRAVCFSTTTLFTFLKALGPYIEEILIGATTEEDFSQEDALRAVRDLKHLRWMVIGNYVVINSNKSSDVQLSIEITDNIFKKRDCLQFTPVHQISLSLTIPSNVAQENTVSCPEMPDNTLLERSLLKYLQYGLPIIQETVKWISLSKTTHKLVICGITVQNGLETDKTEYLINIIDNARRDGAILCFEYEGNDVTLQFTRPNNLPCWLEPEHNAELCLATIAVLRFGSFEGHEVAIEKAMSCLQGYNII